jgi:hypothetical protein
MRQSSRQTTRFQTDPLPEMEQASRGTLPNEVNGSSRSPIRSVIASARHRAQIDRMS